MRLQSARLEFLPFSPPDIGEEEIEAVVQALRSGWLTTGPRTREFSEVFAGYVQSATALAVNSCTGALHVALAALDIGEGDEVITSTMTFCSTAHVIEHTGAQTVLVDIEADTMNLDPAQVEAAITPRTKAIIPVHFAGHPAEMDALLQIAAAHKLTVIEDAAHALPARYRGQIVGSIGDMTAFSFYATKNLTTGEGGMLTGRPELVERARLFSLHGMNRDAWNRYSATGSWYYEVEEAGFKYNMTDMQAAMGLVQLRRLPEMMQKRRTVVQAYQAAFAGLDAVECPSEREWVEHAWHLYVLRLNLDYLTIDRAQFIEEMRSRKIGTSVHFIPVHLHPYYSKRYGYQPADLPVAYATYQRTVSLPLHSRLSASDVQDVIDAVYEICTLYRR